MWTFSVVCPTLMQRFLLQDKKQQLSDGLDVNNNVNNDSVSSLQSPGLVAQFLLAHVYFTSLWREGGGGVWGAFIFICLNINVMNLI